MGEPRGLVVKPREELERRLERLSDRALSIAEETYAVAAEPVPVVKDEGNPDAPPRFEFPPEWTPRQRKLWLDAQRCDSEAPVYLKFALRFNEAVNRKEQDRDGRKVGINIENAVINLPPQLPPDPDDQVKVIDVETLKDGEE